MGRSLADLPPLPEDIRKWRILLLVSATNSLTQRVATYLSDLGCERVSIELAITDENMVSAVLAHSPHVVLCPFLTKKVPDVIWDNVLTLIVHPGPPGDAGPAAIDWAVMGDRGFDANAATALPELIKPQDRALPLQERQRTHWGVTVLQADNTMDGGPVWAFDQFPLPDVSGVTKSIIYQGPVTAATLRAVTVALTRISAAYSKLPDPTHRAQRMGVRVDPKWAAESVSTGGPFLGGPLNERPQIRPGQRRPNFQVHTAADVARIINCGDSQPGGTLKTTKSFLFAYDAKMHMRAADLPADLPNALGFESFDAIPAGQALATRDGAVLFKTAPCAHGSSCAYDCGVAVWFTHGRVPKAEPTEPLKPKVPMAEALVAAGEGAKLDGVPEWPVVDFTEIPGTWQQVFVRSVKEGDAVVQLVYWDFYNGAMSTTGCEHLVKALQWAAEPARGNVKLLALMGGSYFSNGVALNIIESAGHPGRETWANINAIDDVVEFLAGEVASQPRSDFLTGVPSLSERGIATVACLRGNAAAGGVALAAACDVVISAGTVVLNPAYRAMGLHGSEFHLYSYVQRCGRSTATHLVKDMLPVSAIRGRELGLVDIVVGDRDTPAADAERLIIEQLCTLASAPTPATPQFQSAPWTKTVNGTGGTVGATLIDLMCDNKRRRYESSEHIPLVNYRNEELSQMLLDSFHPHRSQRYHSRRIKFVRKVKADGTPTRFSQHRIHVRPDEEETSEFDDAPGWVRGEEWSWVGLQTPATMASSQRLLIDFSEAVPPLSPSQRSDASVSSVPSAEIMTDHGSALHSPALAGSFTGGLSAASSPVNKQPPSAFKSHSDAPALRPADINTSAGVLRKSTPMGAPPQSPRKKSSFIGRLAGAFRSRTDLRGENKDTSALSPPPAPRRRVSLAPPPLQPSYVRPKLANEGNTESPCLFNVTAEGGSVIPQNERERAAVVA